MSCYLYIYQNRVIYWKEFTPTYRPVSHDMTKWVISYQPAPKGIEVLIERGVLCYNLRKGFYTDETPETEKWKLVDDVVEEIKLLERFENLATSYRHRYSNNYVGKPLEDILLIGEMAAFGSGKPIEECKLLNSLLKTKCKGLTPDALVMQMMLKFDSFKSVICYLNEVEETVRGLISQKKYDEVSAMIEQEFEKIRV